MVTSVFVQSAAQGGREEIARVFGAASVRRVLPVLARPDGGVIHTVRQGHRFVLRQLARALYLSPVLILAKLVARAFDERIADLILVGFCVIVVAFFVVLNLYVLWSLAWWIQTHARKVAAPKLRALEPRVLPEPGRVKVRGRIERLGPGDQGDAVVLRDYWADATLPWRITEAAVFLVRPDDPSQPPVVVACTTAPEVAGHTTKRSPRAVLDAVSPDARALASTTADPDDSDAPGLELTFSAGDRVEVTAVRAEPIDNLDRIPLPGGEIIIGDPEGAPYRDNEANVRTGLLFLDDATSPLCIHRAG